MGGVLIHLYEVNGKLKIL